MVDTAMTDDQCRTITDNVRRHGTIALLKDDGPTIWHAFHAAEACRRMAEFDLAAQLIAGIAVCSFAAQDAVKATIERHTQQISNRDSSPLANDLISFWNAPALAPAPTKCTDQTPLPPLLIRGWNFAWAMARWAGSGFEMRTQDEINERLAICQDCIHLVDNHCDLCGCACVETNQAMNKLALKTEKCPIGKWE